MAFPFSFLQRRVFRSRSEWWRSSNGWGEAMGSQGFQLRQLWYRNDHVICCANFWRLGGVSILSRFLNHANSERIWTWTSMSQNNLLYYNESNIFSNFDKLSCEYRCLPYTRLKNILLQMQDLTKLQKMHFFIGDTFFSKFVFCSYKSEINATLYNTISWYSLFNFFSFCLSLKQWK